MKKHVQTTVLMAALISGALTTGIAQAGNYAEDRYTETANVFLTPDDINRTR
jgi:hypothetical protein